MKKALLRQLETQLKLDTSKTLLNSQKESQEGEVKLHRKLTTND